MQQGANSEGSLGPRIEVLKQPWNDRTMPAEMRGIELEHWIAGLDQPDLLLHQISQDAFRVHATQFTHGIYDLLEFAKREYFCHGPPMVLIRLHV